MILEDVATEGGPVQEAACPECTLLPADCKCQASSQSGESAESGFDFSSIADAGEVVVEVAAEIVGGIFGAIFD